MAPSLRFFDGIGDDVFFFCLAILKILLRKLREGDVAEDVLVTAGLVAKLRLGLFKGRRQRIGIARALYHMPDVLVLDEATSALDNATEKSIVGTILKLKGRITIISIAHRISTLTDCDFKIKFEKGHAEVVDER